jgi:putative ABC transport system substrate-binding protein
VNNRRKLIVALGAGALALPYCSFAQQQGKVWRVGVLGAGSPSGWAPMVEALRAGLRELGYIEARTINIDYRWADGQYDRLPELVADLIRLKVDVIVSHATAGIVAAKQATTSIPIIMASIGDPVAAGLLTNLSRPGGNITGLSFFTSEIGIKRLELLKEAVPDIKQVGVVWDRSLPRYFMAPMEAAARVIKVAVEFIDVDSADMLESTFAALAKKHVRGVVIRETPMLISNARLVGAIASKYRIAAVGFKEVAEGGGLIGYGADIPAMWRRAATFVDKIFKGAKPGELPVEQATKFDVIVNKKTGSALGVKFPNSILVQATKVIE